MCSKSVRLDEEVYELVESRKRDDETFSDAIARLLDPPPLTDLAGILSEEAAASYRDVIETVDDADVADRERLRERFDEG